MDTNEVLVRRLKERRDNLLSQKKKVDEQLRLVEEMLSGEEAQRILASLEENEGGRSTPSNQQEAIETTIEDLEPVVHFMDLEGVPVWKAAVRVLENLGRPLHSSVLTEAILHAGRDFGGADPEKALSAHVSQHSDVIDQKKSWVYLTEWGEPRVD